MRYHLLCLLSTVTTFTACASQPKRVVLPLGWMGDTIAGKTCYSTSEFQPAGRVAGQGSFHAVAEGVATIQCTENARIEVEVRRIARVAIEVEPRIRVGEPTQLQVAAFDSQGRQIPDDKLRGIPVIWNTTGPLKIHEPCSKDPSASHPVFPCLASGDSSLIATGTGNGTLSVIVGGDATAATASASMVAYVARP